MGLEHQYLLHRKGNLKMNTNRNLYQQGDILFIKIEEMPNNALPLNTSIIAEGEKTGHRHIIKNGNLFSDKEDVFMSSPKRIKVEHLKGNNFNKKENHQPQLLPPGIYKIMKVQEFDHHQSVSMSVID